MKLHAILEAFDDNDEAAFNVKLFGKRIKAAGFVEWHPTNREGDEVFERVTYFKSPAFYEGTFEEDDEQFIVYIEIEGYPMGLKPGNNRGERYMIEMGTQHDTDVFAPAKSRGIRLSSQKDTTTIKKQSSQPPLMLKHVDAMLAAYKKNVESKYKKVPK